MGNIDKNIIQYLRLPESSLLDRLGPFIIIFILLMFLYLAVKLTVWQQRRESTRERKVITRRRFERFPGKLLIKISTLDDKKHYKAEMLDVSEGGMRLIAPLFGIGSTLKYKISSSDPPLREVGEPTIIVLRMNEGEEPDTAVLRAKWIHLSLKQRERLTEEIISKMIRD
ncbi:MAG: PilZ domain-containing protein [Candidatus Electryonea clarkiae]|nr:PilZ domain-containing protein [Candidatus Electryonea clarkiae]MDP8287683.1 PilZ domain-containing protein [Candidatus Electryonea clarkiae]